MVRVGPTPPSAGMLGSSRSQQAGSSVQAVASSTFRYRTVITDKETLPEGEDDAPGYQTTCRAPRRAERPRGGWIDPFRGMVCPLRGKRTVRSGSGPPSAL